MIVDERMVAFINSFDKGNTPFLDELEKYAKETDSIIPRQLWLDDNQLTSWFVKNGKVENCMDTEICMIENERIDEISKVINQDFDRMLELQDGMESVVEECH